MSEDEYRKECIRIAEEERAARHFGICPECGAKNADDAAILCRPYSIADTGDSGCVAEDIGIAWAREDGER